MKLEPVAWANKEDLSILLEQAEKRNPLFCAVCNTKADNATPLYAIPEGYTVVPVGLLKRAQSHLLEWANKYGEHNPQWLPPARTAELAEDLIAAIEGEQ